MNLDVEILFTFLFIFMYFVHLLEQKSRMMFDYMTSEVNFYRNLITLHNKEEEDDSVYDDDDEGDDDGGDDGGDDDEGDDEGDDGGDDEGDDEGDDTEYEQVVREQESNDNTQPQGIYV